MTERKSRVRKATELPSPNLIAAADIQALAAGTAEPHQQARALQWIVEEVAGMYKLNYYATDRDTAFALGRAFVGQVIVGAMKMNMSELRKHG